MEHTNFEIKARCLDHEPVRAALRREGARCRGTDRQIDTYFRVDSGRLKLREGTIENALIHYLRPNAAGPRRSDVSLVRLAPQSGIGPVLAHALGVRVVVDKTREIWFAGNVKVHLDEVVGLGRFLEIEAIDEDGSLGADVIRRQCERFMALFGVADADLVGGSYADLVATPKGSVPS